MITASGIGSGIDVESIVSQLMQFERQPVNALHKKKESLDVELSAFGKLKSAMRELETITRTLGDTTKFGPFKAKSSDEDVFTATATGGKSAEYHTVDVLSLAQAHRMSSDLFDSSEAAVGQGDYSFSSGDNSFSVTINSSNNSLAGLRNAINDSPDNNSVVASLLNVDGGSRLVLTALETGTDNTISMSGGNSTTVNGFSNITEAADAELVINGFDVTSSSNAVTDVIEGVTLNLTGTGSSTVETNRDVNGLRDSLDKFVEKYNSLRSDLDKYAKSDLQGDRLPRNAESSLRDVFSQAISLANGKEVNLLDLGFTFDRYGELSLDVKTLESALDDGQETFVSLFTTADTGAAALFEDVLDKFTAVDGLISNRERGIETRQDTLDDNIERLDLRLENTEARYRRQFATMDQLVSQLQSTGSFLTSRLLG